MKYIIHTSRGSKEIKRLVVIYPGMDDLTEEGSQEPKTSNNIDKYDLFAKFTAAMSEPGVAVIVIEYSGPHAWGEAIDFNILTSEIEHTLQAAIKDLAERKLCINIEKIDLGSHSYGFTALFWSLANGIFSRVIRADCKFTTGLHLFEPYGIAAMKAATKNTLAFRENDVVAAAQQRFFDLTSNPSPAQAAQQELTQLMTFDSVKNIDIILGLFRPTKSIHDSYGEINANAMQVNLTKVNKVGHGGALLDILKASKSKSSPRNYALEGFQILMHAWICSLRGVRVDDSIAKNFHKEIADLCEAEQLIPPPHEVVQKTESTPAPTIMPKSKSLLPGFNSYALMAGAASVAVAACSYYYLRSKI